jgi:hypothetical protein
MPLPPHTRNIFDGCHWPDGGGYGTGGYTYTWKNHIDDGP